MTQGQSPKPPAAQAADKQPRSRPGAKKTKRTTPRWVTITRRVLVYAGIPMLFLICLYIGLYIGYVKLGEQPAEEIWQWSTWKHVYDLVFADS